MSANASSSRHAVTPFPSRRPSWTERTFVASDEAEAALCSDRPEFIKRKEILNLVPERIKKRIIHTGDNAQIKGFEELFIYLNENPGQKKLRQLIISYFKSSPSLHELLSQCNSKGVTLR